MAVKFKSLPLGFRFHPTDIELVKYYLKRKVLGKRIVSDVIAEVDIYKNEPWDLPDKSYLPSRDLKWYFFCPREKKYASGGRLNRATEKGYWKTTGKDRAVVCNAATVGMIKTLVYHTGRAPKGDRTDWVMHEYRLEEKDLADRGIVQDAFVLCIIFQKEGPGPRNGAQYGAPFNEDEWSDNEEVNCGEVAIAESQPAPVLLLPTQSQSGVTITPAVSESIYSASESYHARSEILPSANQLPPIAENNDLGTWDTSQVQGDDDILTMLDLFQEDEGPVSTKKYETEGVNNSNNVKDAVAATSTDGNDSIFEGLGDLKSWFGLGENGAGLPSNCPIEDYNMDQMLWEASTSDNPTAFIQLTDLDTPLKGPVFSSSNPPSATAPPQPTDSDYHLPRPIEKASQQAFPGFSAHPPQLLDRASQLALPGSAAHSSQL